VNIKKGQFTAPAAMQHAAEKASAAGAGGVLLTERGTSFGYGDLVVSSARCPTAASALELYRETCDPAYRAVVERVLRYIDREALRTTDGGLNHLGTEDLFGISLWLDSLFMFGVVLTRWGEYTGEAAYLDELAGQYRVFVDKLHDAGGWMVHAHDWPVSPQTPGVYWARGNGWVTAAGYDYLRVRQARGERDDFVEQALARQVSAIIADQDPMTGLWWTIVNRPGETYLETSASALFAAGMARGHRLGFLGEEVLPSIAAAMVGVRTQIAPDGTVSGISGPTTVGDFDHYAAIPVEDDIPYGVGAVLLALVETSGLV
jgi:unsaturated rhamnogalacturonyl hydrolase